MVATVPAPKLGSDFRSKQGACQPENRENQENREFSGNSVSLEKSGRFQGILTEIDIDQGN